MGPVKLLVLGGTVFLSREVAAEAVRRGHDVVCACRGESGAVPDGATLLRWDRSEPAPPELTASGPYDAVVDVARLPSHVRAALAVTPGAHWVFVSTVNVYADDADPGGPGVGRLREPVTDDLNPGSPSDAYGAMKVACEQLVLDGAASAAVARPGLIVGPGDPTGRFSYWARRFTAGGPVLAPGSPDDLVQVIDVRDLAAWLVTLAEERRPGTYDAVGEAMRIEDLLHACAPGAELVWAAHELLQEQGVEPWMGPDSIPLWLPRPEYDGMAAHDARPAVAAGLRLRPLAETTRDTQEWLAGEPEAPVTGITPEREAELLAGLETVAARPPRPPG